MNKYYKRLIYLTLSILLIISINITVYAAGGTAELEPNNTKDTAMEIYRKTVTADDWAGSININFDYTTGTILDPSDEDWFKVWLPSGSNTLNFNNYTAGSAILFKIEDVNGTSVLDSTIMMSGSMRTISFNVPSSGYYYI